MTSVAHQGVNPAMPKGVCALPYNLTDCRPLMRAALVALDPGQPLPAYRRWHAGALSETQSRRSPGERRQRFRDEDTPVRTRGEKYRQIVLIFHRFLRERSCASTARSITN
jgi:hypothetical protein